ncbi:MAG: hypothetical protein COV67_05860 [Nitrospinae bacterium CG11_big_fil_rev_8_21_14_0_20_56_8]|nr:MAG: hypothetical protein COV67_05860 [Nitrospinae bacterium CG11_big_fil_rev_8_21_14_0_20_56_8]
MTAETFDRRTDSGWPSAVIAVLGILVYFHGLGNGFLNYDDADQRLLNNPFLAGPLDWEAIQAAFTRSTGGYYDPVYALSYALDIHLWGWNPAGIHLGNLVLHCLNSVLLYSILARLTGDRALAFLAGIFFVVHPIHVESVSWATSRKDTLSLFFGLASLSLYWKGEGAARGKFILHLSGAVALLLLGMMTKPTVIVLPIVGLLAEVLLRRRPPAFRRMWLFQGACFVMVGIFLAATLPLAVGDALKPDLRSSPVGNGIFFADLYGYFTRLILFPLNLCALYLIPFNKSMGYATAAGIFTLVLIGAGWVAGVRRYFVFAGEREVPIAPASWGLAVFGAGLFPFTNVVPRTIYLADRYEYIASMGFCLILAVGIMRLSRPVYRAVLGVLLVVLFSALSIDRVKVWRDSPTLWADADRKRNIPSAQHHLLMGDSFAFHGRWREAAFEYEAAGPEQVTDPAIMMKVANGFVLSGNLERAETLVRAFLIRDPDFLSAASWLVLVRVGVKDYPRARGILDEFADRFTPQEYGFLKDLIEYDKEGEREEASRAYRDLTTSLGRRMRDVQR